MFGKSLEQRKREFYEFGICILLILSVISVLIIASIGHFALPLVLPEILTREVEIVNEKAQTVHYELRLQRGLQILYWISTVVIILIHIACAIQTEDFIKMLMKISEERQEREILKKYSEKSAA